MSRKPHIVYVCADRGIPIGGHKGGSAHVGELTRALRERGADVRIVAARVRDEAAPDELPAVTVDLGGQRAVRQMRQIVFSGASAARAQAANAEAFGLLLNQAVGKALERLHKEWRVDAVYERYSLWSHAAAGFAQALGVPYLLEVNAPLRAEQRRYRSLENASAAERIESYVLRCADRVLVPSEALRPYVIARGAAPAAVQVVPNAADPERFSPARGRKRSTAQQDGRPFVIGFTGSLKPWHGLSYLVRVFRRLHRADPSYRLLIVGDGPERAGLEKTLRKQGLAGAVTFSGAVDIERVAELLGEMDVAVAPYPRLPEFYFSPLKVFEYMAAGVPIVASDIGQIGDVLTHRRTALLHPPGAVTEMAEAIAQLRRRPALAARLAHEARALLRRRYTWRRNAERVMAGILAVQKRKKAAR